MQLRGLTLMAFFVSSLVVAFVGRMVVVYLQVFEPNINFGQAIYLGFGVIACEGYGCLIILCVSLLSFHQTKKETSRPLTQELLKPETSGERQVPARYADY
jgi:hypothetical protein